MAGMARIRTIKPEFFKHEVLFDLEKETGLPIRVAFAGLLTCCDREGRFKWRPRRLKADALPYDEVDFSLVLDAMFKKRLILKYRVDGDDYGCIPSWKKHQIIHNTEAKSVLPSPPQSFALETENDISETTVNSPLDNRESAGRKGKEGKGKEEENQPPTPLGPAALVSQENPKTEIDIDPWQAGQATAELLGLGGQQKALARDACAAVKRRKPEMRFTETPEFVCKLWREYDSLAVHAKVSLKTFLGEIGRFMDSDSWRAQPSRASPTLDERGGHFEGSVYVTKDGTRMPGYIPPPKAATS